MLNKIILMGRLTRDPELRRTGSGTAVTSFALAVDRDFKGQGGEKETDFIDVVAWRNTAEFVSKYFAKGRMAWKAGFRSATGRTKRATTVAVRRSWPTTSISGTATRTAVIGLEAEATVAATTTATSSPAEIFPRFPMTTPANSRSDRRMRDGTTNYPLLSGVI